MLHIQDVIKSLCLQIPNGDGALALHVMPRYVLHNNLKQALQYKQQVHLQQYFARFQRWSYTPEAGIEAVDLLQPIALQ